MRPLQPTLDLIVEDFKGREIDPVIHQDFNKFLSDDDFVKSREFLQFFWRINIQNFEVRCKKMKIEKPNKEDSIIEE